MEHLKKVSEEETIELYKFIRLHFVEHFDVQIELVDHLACSIEDIWKEKPETTFEAALNSTFKSFGIFGFNDYVSQETDVMWKVYFKKILQQTRNRLKWPQILSSLSLSILIFYITKFFNYSPIPIIILFVVSAVLGLIKLYSYNIKWNRKVKGIKLLAIETSIRIPGSLIYLGQLFFVQFLFQNHVVELFLNPLFLIFFTFIFSLYTLVMYDSIYSLENEIEKSYMKYLKFA